MGMDRSPPSVNSAPRRAYAGPVLLQAPIVRGEAFGQEFGEGSHLGGKVPAARVYDVDAGRERGKTTQDRYEASCADVGSDDEIGLVGDADALASQCAKEG